MKKLTSRDEAIEFIKKFENWIKWEILNIKMFEKANEIFEIGLDETKDNSLKEKIKNLQKEIKKSVRNIKKMEKEIEGWYKYINKYAYKKGGNNGR